MASFHFLIFSLLLILTTTTASSTMKTQESPQQPQFNAIIDSIVGAGDFANWANLLSQADPSIFPLSATFFIPDDDAFLANANANASSPSSSSSSVSYVDPLLFPYHVIPRRFAFADLLLFPIGARLPTLLPGNTLIITNNSASNFTINGAALTHADLFRNAFVTAHGVSSVLNYTLFGKEPDVTASAPEAENPFSPEKSPEQDLVVGPTPSMGIEQEERGPVIGSVTSEAVLLAIFRLDGGEVVFLLMLLWILLG